MKSSRAKGSREERNRVKHRPQKRKFYGNAFTTEKSTTYTSASSKKLRDSNSLGASYNPAIEHVFLSFTQFFFKLSNFVKCNVCDDEITFMKTCVKGLGFQVQLVCNCDTNRTINSCS